MKNQKSKILGLAMIMGLCLSAGCADDKKADAKRAEAPAEKPADSAPPPGTDTAKEAPAATLEQDLEAARKEITAENANAKADALEKEIMADAE